MNLTKKKLRESYNSTIFTDVYRKNLWGGKAGEFYSGPGSHNSYVPGYAKVMADFITNNDVRNIVEIGCGDFNVTNTILNLLKDKQYDLDYTGYDVVKPLININKIRFGANNINFVCKDSCTGKIKGGDLLIIRQVIQHLSNKAILQVIAKFPNYKYIIVTEHQVSEKHRHAIQPNIDQSTGASVRLMNGSGVYLDQAPFNCNIDRLMFSFPEYVFHVEAAVNTFLIINN